METLRDWLAEHPPPDDRFTQTVASVAERVQAGEQLRFAVRELLDEFALRGRDELRAAALAEEPANVDPHVDAYLGALAEHLARSCHLSTPRWALSETRMLDHMWFPGVARGFRPTALRESPAAFRRRGIFIARGALTRV
ncbi:MAG: hypothetical protein ACJ76L_10470 [Conexibacter sp.]